MCVQRQGTVRSHLLVEKVLVPIVIRAWEVRDIYMAIFGKCSLPQKPLDVRVFIWGTVKKKIKMVSPPQGTYMYT